jgi:hypothetical protein
MICPTCHGAVLDGGERAYPCPDCQGSGIVSCCDTAGTAAANEWGDKTSDDILSDVLRLMQANTIDEVLS